MQKCTGVQVVLKHRGLCERIDEFCTCLSCAFQISCSFFCCSSLVLVS